MNIYSKASLLALSLIFASAAGASTSEMVKQIKDWGTDLERRLETAEDNNAKLQKQLDKVSTQLKSTEADRDGLKDELVQSRRALKDAEKAADIASRRADKADRELARANERAERDAAKMAASSKPAVVSAPAAKSVAAPVAASVADPLAAPVVEQADSKAMTIVEVPAAMNDQAPVVAPAAAPEMAAPAMPAAPENKPIIVDGVLIPAVPAAVVKDLPKEPKEMLMDKAKPMLENTDELVDDMMTTEDDDTE